MANVHGVHSRRAVLQQTIGEPAGGRADVEAVEPTRVDAEAVEAVGELLAAPRDVGRQRLDRQLRRLVDLLSRLLEPRHEAGHHERLGLRTRLRETPFHEEDVDPLLHTATQM